MTKLYTFKNVDGYSIYLSEIDTPINPQTGDILIPAYATIIAPPEPVEGYKRHFKRGEWLSVIDNVGTVYWLGVGQRFEITKLGVEIPDNALLEEPLAPITVEIQTEKANSESKRRIESEWDQVAQSNVALGGIYTEEEELDCRNWIKLNRAALSDILDRSDLLEIDVTDDQYWPVYGDEVIVDIEVSRKEKLAELETIYKTKNPLAVDINGIFFQGGNTMVGDIITNIDSAKLLGSDEVTIYDIDGIAHVFSREESTLIAVTINTEYNRLVKLRNDAVVEIKAATTLTEMETSIRTFDESYP